MEKSEQKFGDFMIHGGALLQIFLQFKSCKYVPVKTTRSLQ